MQPVADVFLGNDAVLVGRARFTLRRGQIATSFMYDDAYLSRSDAFAIDPSLPLSERSGFVAGLPGAFSDAAPDRWGRRLIRRASARVPDEVDYLLGVYDRTRQGALRFKLPETSTFCTEDAEVPPVVRLPRLLAACRAVLTEDDAAEEVKCLLDAGSSTLGGARPKATVDDGGDFYIAKFPAPGDEHDVMAWEKTALDLASLCGIEVPDSRLVRIGGEGVLLTRRFDRGTGVRIPYLSAMSLLGARDGECRDYVEMAEALASFVGSPERDLRELFRRMVFSIVVNNTDDHLRNHGFLRAEGCWRLSPAFDINPNSDVRACRATSIFGECGRRQSHALFEAASYFGIDTDGARSVVSSVLTAFMADWRTTARRNGCPEAETIRFGRVFGQRAEELREAFRI